MFCGDKQRSRPDTTARGRPSRVPREGSRTPRATRVAPLGALSRTRRSLGAGRRAVAAGAGAGFLMGPKGFLLGATKMLRKWTEVMVAEHCERTKGHLVVHLNVVHFMLYDFYLNYKYLRFRAQGDLGVSR